MEKSRLVEFETQITVNVIAKIIPARLAADCQNPDDPKFNDDGSPVEVDIRKIEMDRYSDIKIWLDDETLEEIREKALAEVE